MRKISTPAMTLCLALMAGPVAGVAQAVTVKYPDVDLIALKTTGGFLGGSSFSTSYVKWNSNKGFTRYYYFGDDVGEGRCMGVFEKPYYTNGTVGNRVKLGQVCHPGSTGSTETRVFGDQTSTKIYSKLVVQLCRLTSTGATDNCAATTVKPGVD